MKNRALLALAGLAIPLAVTVADDDIDEIRAILESQQDQIELLKKNTSSSTNQGVNIGGYGELHYNKLSNKEDQIDFHRFVLFFSKDFSDKVHFFSEFELEHAIAGEGQTGEVELEQAYVDFNVTDNHNIRTGLFLVPVGILNETHEPPTFYGTERNPVEKNIIPATWWEGGVGVNGQLMPGLSYDFNVTSGLNNDEYKIRSGRQKVGNAVAENFAYTGRVKWTSIPGLELAATAQLQTNITQGTDDDASASLIEAHAIYNMDGFGLRALYAGWNVNGDGAKAKGRDEQNGYYIEPSYRVNQQLGVFARYNAWDNAAGDDADSEYSQIDVGINYWPHEDVVLKVDYQDQTVPSDKTENDGVNLGFGYQF